MHGAGELGIFFKDQTVADSPSRWWEPLAHVPLYAILTWASVLPWSAAAIALALRKRPSDAPADASGAWFARFALLWSLLLVLVFSASTWVDGRYLLPAGPFLAVWLACALAASGASDRILVMTFRACAAGLAAVGAVLVGLWAAIGLTIGAAALLGALAAVMVAVFVARRRVSPALGIALATFAAFPLGAAGLAPIVKPDTGVIAAARELALAPGDPPRSVLVIGPQILASNLRVATGGRRAVDRVPIRGWRELSAARERWPRAMVLPSAQAAQVDLAGYRTREVALGLDGVSLGDLLRAVSTGGAASFLEAHRARYVVAVRE